MKLNAYLLIGLMLVVTGCGDGTDHKGKDCPETILRDYHNDASGIYNKPNKDRKGYCENMVSKYEKYDGCKIPMHINFTDAQGTIGVREFLIATLKGACNKM